MIDADWRRFKMYKQRLTTQSSGANQKFQQQKITKGLIKFQYSLVKEKSAKTNIHYVLRQRPSGEPCARKNQFVPQSSWAHLTSFLLFTRRGQQHQCAMAKIHHRPIFSFQ
jgi:hypothetical protein